MIETLHAYVQPTAGHPSSSGSEEFRGMLSGHAHKDDKYIETGADSTSAGWAAGGSPEISRYPPTRDCTG